MYKLIWLDYFDHSKSERTGCFIYRFLKKNKTLRCQKLSADMQALTDYSKQKRYDKYTLLKGLRFAYKNNVSDREHYIGILSDITGNDISSLTEKSDNELESISEAYEEKLLFGCITDFFQNSGYRFRKKAPDGIAINDEYVEKCWKLYEEQDDVFIPLCFDVRSGAGIYIIGSERFIGTDIEFDDIPCCIFISSFFNVDSCDYDNEEMLLAMQFTRAESVHEAFDMFRKNETAFFRHYPNENDRLPENADKCFNIFFNRSASLRTEKLVQKLLERENNDLKKMSAKNPYSHR